jgi:O-antigen/teichoic acid export membrane protein
MSLAKRVFGATAIITVAKGLTKLIALLAAPILTVQLGPQPYGVMALIYTVTSLGGVFGLMGIDLSYTRNFFGKGNKVNYVIEQFCWRYAFVMAFIFAILTGVIWFYLLAQNETANLYTSAMLGFLVFLGVQNIMAETRRRLRGDYLRIAIAVILSSVCMTALNIGLATYWRHDYRPLLIGAVVCVALNVLMLRLPAFKPSTTSPALSRTEAVSIVMLGVPNIFSSIMHWVMTSSDRWYIAAFASQETVGIYAFSANLALVGMMLNNAITMSWFPEASRVYEQNSNESLHSLGRLWSRLAATLMLVWLGVTAFGGDLLRLLTDPRFHVGDVYIPWLAGGVFFFGITSLANTGLVLTKNMKPLAYWWCVAGCTNLIANYFIVPSYGALGAAIVNCISYAIPAVSILIISQQRYPMNITWRSLMFSAFLVMGVGWCMARPWHDQALISGGLKMGPYFLITLVVIRLTAHDWLSRALKPFLRTPRPIN